MLYTRDLGRKPGGVKTKTSPHLHLFPAKLKTLEFFTFSIMGISSLQIQLEHEFKMLLKAPFTFFSSFCSQTLSNILKGNNSV